MHSTQGSDDPEKLPLCAQKLRRHCRRLTISRAGVATVEFALVLPILVVLLLIAAHFGRILYTAVTIGHAARAGAQYGAQTSVLVRDTAGIRVAAAAEAVNIGAITVASQFYCKCADGSTVNCVTATCAAYGPPQLFLEVTASKSVSWAMPWPTSNGTIPISRSAILRVQ